MAPKELASLSCEEKILSNTTIEQECNNITDKYNIT